MGALTSRKKQLTFQGEDVNFDHFQVLRAIGRGSFGKVCIVQKKDSKQMFAMKYMNKAQCQARDALNNVFREIEILATLNHPFLVNLWFSFQDAEDMFTVVELLVGGDLRYHVQQGVNFGDDSVRLFVLEVGSALSYLHARHIIHRDIKPDNLLLDEEGHVHLTDFNIATVVRPGQLATSMSGTKPYMAPEVFACAAEECLGYGPAVDWWSLGVSAYEIRKGRRPFDIHSSTSLSEVRHMFLHLPKFPADCHPGLVQLISQLLSTNPEKRISSMEQVQQIPFAAALRLDDVMHKRCRPAFTPPRDHLNCDPTFELEEMIIESRPLHKKKKRLSKQKSLRDTQSSLSAGNADAAEGQQVYGGMPVFNREVEEARKEKERKQRERERREREWQQELEDSMRRSDPTGHGSSFCGSHGNTPVKQRAQEPPLTPDPTLTFTNSCDLEHLPRTAVSPSNVRARIAGSPKVKVRGSTVTIQSPRSSSSQTRSSAHHLKERLRELQGERRPPSQDSGSLSGSSDVTPSARSPCTPLEGAERSPTPPPQTLESTLSLRSPERSQGSPGKPERSEERRDRVAKDPEGSERSEKLLSKRLQRSKKSPGRQEESLERSLSLRSSERSQKSHKRSPQKMERSESSSSEKTTGSQLEWPERSSQKPERSQLEGPEGSPQRQERSQLEEPERSQQEGQERSPQKTERSPQKQEGSQLEGQERSPLNTERLPQKQKRSKPVRSKSSAEKPRMSENLQRSPQRPVSSPEVLERSHARKLLRSLPTPERSLVERPKSSPDEMERSLKVERSLLGKVHPGRPKSTPLKLERSIQRRVSSPERSERSEKLQVEMPKSSPVRSERSEKLQVERPKSSPVRSERHKRPEGRERSERPKSSPETHQRSPPRRPERSKDKLKGSPVKHARSERSPTETAQRSSEKLQRSLSEGPERSLSEQIEKQRPVSSPQRSTPERPQRSRDGLKSSQEKIEYSERSQAQTPERSQAQTPERSQAHTPERSQAQTPERSQAQTPERSQAQTPERSQAQTSERSARPKSPPEKIERSVSSTKLKKQSTERSKRLPHSTPGQDDLQGPFRQCQEDHEGQAKGRESEHVTFRPFRQCSQEGERSEQQPDLAEVRHTWPRVYNWTCNNNNSSSNNNNKSGKPR